MRSVLLQEISRTGAAAPGSRIPIAEQPGKEEIAIVSKVAGRMTKMPHLNRKITSRLLQTTIEALAGRQVSHGAIIAGFVVNGFAASRIPDDSEAVIFNIDHHSFDDLRTEAKKRLDTYR
jgi:hypothetical protein